MPYVLIHSLMISKPSSGYLSSFFFRFTTKPQFTVYRVLQQIDWFNRGFSLTAIKWNFTNRARTCDILINSQTLYQLSYGEIINTSMKKGSNL